MYNARIAQSVEHETLNLRVMAFYLLVSIVDSISACHAEDRGSIPRWGELVLYGAVVA